MKQMMVMMLLLLLILLNSFVGKVGAFFNVCGNIVVGHLLLEKPLFMSNKVFGTTAGRNVIRRSDEGGINLVVVVEGHGKGEEDLEMRIELLEISIDWLNCNQKNI